MFGRGNSMSIVAMEQSMQEFVDGMIVTLLPSMLVVAWLVWRAAGEQLASSLEILDLTSLCSRAKGFT
jgi:hypothetical protein